MKPHHKLNIINGFGSLARNTIIKLLLFSPIFCVVFIAYGDRFLPEPFNHWSFQARSGLNNLLVGSFIDDFIKNSDYNNKKSDELIKGVEKKNKDR